MGGGNAAADGPAPGNVGAAPPVAKAAPATAPHGDLPLAPGPPEPGSVCNASMEPVVAQPGTDFAHLLDLRRNPAVRSLEEFDERLTALEREHEAERLAVKRRYEEQYKVLLQRRREVLTAGDGAAPEPSAKALEATAPPALRGFWRTALQNSPDFQREIERYDEPVLDYLRDIQFDWLDEAVGRDSGFRVRFFFESNPYFSNTVLEKAFHLERKGRFIHRTQCCKITATAIKWYSGKNVTVDVVSKKSKPKSTGRRRGTKPRKEEVPRPSFFRMFFRNLGPDEAIPEEELDESDGETLDDLMHCLLEDDFDQGLALIKHIIPHAIRWYTGEACDDEDDEGTGSEGAASTEEASEEDEDEEEDGEEDSEEEEKEDMDAGAGASSSRGRRDGGSRGAGRIHPKKAAAKAPAKPSK
mmetsp:Transcript_63696/g.136919  ORF Transcript_63696/g.136919 Transcript_63696/m.136919 type:complete len:414 (+) Transcript_63696:73-1314(+)